MTICGSTRGLSWANWLTWERYRSSHLTLGKNVFPKMQSSFFKPLSGWNGAGNRVCIVLSEWDVFFHTGLNIHKGQIILENCEMEEWGSVCLSFFVFSWYNMAVYTVDREGEQRRERHIDQKSHCWWTEKKRKEKKQFLISQRPIRTFPSSSDGPCTTIWKAFV